LFVVVVMVAVVVVISDINLEF